MERKEAIEVVKKNYPHVTESGSQFETALRTLIPELKESEDERIIKRIKKAVESYWSDEPLDEILAWLEKQGEQNPAWSEEDEAIYYGVIETEQYMLDVVNGITKFNVGNISIKEECTRELNWLKSLKDRYTWKPSEESFNNTSCTCLSKKEAESKVWKQ